MLVGGVSIADYLSYKHRQGLSVRDSDFAPGNSMYGLYHVPMANNSHHLLKNSQTVEQLSLKTLMIFITDKN